MNNETNELILTEYVSYNRPEIVCESCGTDNRVITLYPLDNYSYYPMTLCLDCFGDFLLSLEDDDVEGDFE